MKKSILFSLTVCSLLIACGGGSDSSETPNTPAPVTPPTEPTLYVGRFVDSPVINLNYRTETQSGATNTEGEFNFAAGEKVTFSIGGIDFPEVDAKTVLTPLDIFNTLDVNSPAVINMLRLLQSLDVDGDASNGIELSDLLHVLASNFSLDFTQEEFETLVSDLLMDNNAINISLISAEQALAHFNQTLASLNITPTCGADHARVGHTGSFQTLHHNVSGQATIIDNCTIQIESFTYDGQGPDVHFYGALDSNFTGSSAFSIGDEINGRAYNNETVTVKIPLGKTLDDINSLSVWCVDVSVNFGDVLFTPP